LSSQSASEEFSTPVLSADRRIKAKKYARINRRLSFLEAVLSAALLLWLIFSGFSSEIVSFIGLPAVPAAVVYSLVLVVVYGVLSTPVNYYRGFVLARRYGLSNQGFAGWLGDSLQSGALTSILAISVVAIAYWAVGVLPELWWLVVWGFLLVISLILSTLLPVVLIPMFYRTKPLEDENLKQRFTALAEKAGVSIKGVYTIEFSSKQTTANAALMGMGRTRRVALSDTLLAEYSPEEIETVIAHELGHHKHRDFVGIFLFQALILFACLWITGIAAGALAEPLGFGGMGDAAMLPLLILVFAIVNLILTPVSNAVMRSFEMAADDFAIRLTGNPQAFISMITKLTQQNLGEVNPPLWVELLLDDHPGYYRRISYARRFMRNNTETMNKG
jgi:STE24 endopeptidase